MDFISSIPSPLHESPHSLWYPSTTTTTTSTIFNLTPTPLTPSTANNTNTNTSSNQNPHAAQQAAQQAASLQHSRRGNQTNSTPRTALSSLRADEKAISIRREQIRRFGAGWLKPPGVTKTLKGMMEEKAEREEAEKLAAREQALAEEQAAAAAQAAETAMAEGGGPGGREGGMVVGAEVGEVDLDDEIPDADDGETEAGDWMDSEGEIDEEDDGGLPMNEGDGDFEADGYRATVIGDGAADVAGGERNLDDDVPEAGSYQHTDTDVEDQSSSDVEVAQALGGSSVLGLAGMGSSPAPMTMGRRQR